MPEKFVVPQFIDNEDKILGPITVRQFLICLFSLLPLFILYRIFPFLYFVPLGLMVLGLAGTFAFLRVNGQPFHVFAMNALQTGMRPALRVWNRQLDEAQIRAQLHQEREAAKRPKVVSAEVKPLPAMRHLRDLSLMVNTGGVYNPNDDQES
jgi:hypothetical protein